MNNIHNNTDVELKIQELPTNMNVSHVAEFLGISMTTAYKLVKSPDFPVIKMSNIRRVIIPKNRFLEWYSQPPVEHP